MTAIASRPPWVQAYWNSFRNPKLFATDVLGVTLEPWQAEAFDRIATGDRLSIRAGHGVGKTAWLSWLSLWFLLTRFPCKIPITANSQDQLRDVVFAEISSWARRLPDELRSQLKLDVERVSIAAAPEEGFIVARTASEHRPEALQGFHSPNLLFVIEEASGITEKVFEVGMGALSTPGAKVVMLGNPTRPSGFFYDSFHRLRERWQTMRVSSEDVARARGHIEDVIAMYGRDSNAYRIRVLGEFPTTADEQVIPLDLVEAAIKRDVRDGDAWRPVWGLDVARFGDDRTALAKRQGPQLLEPIKWWRGKDLMQVAGLVMDEYRYAEQVTPDLVPSEILVDVIGLGAGVVDRLNELRLPVRGINVGESASASDRYSRLRDELWFKGRTWFQDRNCKIPDDRALIAELVAPTYTFTSSGKILVESKQDMKDRGVASPDLADAFLLTLAGGLDRRDPGELDRYRRKRGRSANSWMSA